MSTGISWGASPIDLGDEEPGETKFLAEPVAEDIGALERTAKWSESGVRGGLGWISGVLVTSTLALLALNSHALANWADQLPVTDSTAPIINAAQAWHARSGQLGLNTVVDKVEKAANKGRKAGWP